MSDDAIAALAAKKAKVLADAQKEAAEIDADMAALSRLKNKYHLDIVARAPGGQTVVLEAKGLTTSSPRLGTPTISAHESTYTRAKGEAEALIRANGKPLHLSDIYDALVKIGINIGGKTPKNTLSAYLGQNPNLQSTPRGWWLKDVPLPPRSVTHHQSDNPEAGEGNFHRRI